MHKLHKKFTTFLRSPYCFYLILFIFVVEAAWIAFSARYPMAFDEAYHIGITRLYSHQFSPFLTHQPPGLAPYGALARDPSYLYHWLMSFPYRWLNGASLQVQIVSLRLINVALFAWSLVLFRRVLLKTRATPAVVHTTLFFFILVPVVPQLAGQNNYDNLQNLLIAWALLLTIQFRQALLAQKRVDHLRLALLITVCLLGCLVKFTFLPIITAIAIYLAFLLIRTYKPYKLKKLHTKNWRLVKPWQKATFGTALVISVGLFVQMYGVNVIKYHNIIPQCGQVLGVERCMAYGPWARNYDAAQRKKTVDPNPIAYSGTWLGGMFMRSFFVINGPGPVAQHENHLPIVLSVVAGSVFIIGFGLAIRYSRGLLARDPLLVMLLFVCLVYIAAVWGRNYHDYLQLGQAVAINGRYLVPVILPINLAIVLACQRALAKKRQLQTTLALGVFFCFLQGGGVLSFINYSNDNWYWVGSPSARRLNHSAQKLVRPLMLSNHVRLYKKPS